MNLRTTKRRVETSKLIGKYVRVYYNNCLLNGSSHRQEKVFQIKDEKDLQLLKDPRIYRITCGGIK